MRGLRRALPRRCISTTWRAAAIDGQRVADGVLEGVRRDVADLKATHGVTPGLSVIVVGARKDSLKYVQKKEQLAEKLGIKSTKIALPADATASQLRNVIEEQNSDPDCDGVLLQLPLPPHLSARAALLAIDPSKDVDGFHPVNVGRLASWREATLAPCTPRGVMEMLWHANVPLGGAHVAVVGESNVVGQPLALMLLAAKATVTVVHEHTPDPAALCREADVVVSAAGVAGLVTRDWVTPGATVIDVGINFVPSPEHGGKLRMCGDVADCVWDVAAKVSPVPGGVGPMTVAMLMRNTIDAALLRLKWLDVRTPAQRLADAADAATALCAEVAPPPRCGADAFHAEEEIDEVAPPRRTDDVLHTNLWWLDSGGSDLCGNQHFTAPSC